MFLIRDPVLRPVGFNNFDKNFVGAFFAYTHV
jgi:hypothetical protein